MKIKVTTLYVDDQEKALRFYTDVLGFVKKTDFSQGPYRWLTIASQRNPTARKFSSHSTTIPQRKRISRRFSSRTSPPPCSSPTTCRPTTTA